MISLNWSESMSKAEGIFGAGTGIRRLGGGLTSEFASDIEICESGGEGVLGGVLSGLSLDRLRSSGGTISTGGGAKVSGWMGTRGLLGGGEGIVISTGGANVENRFGLSRGAPAGPATI